MQCSAAWGAVQSPATPRNDSMTELRSLGSMLLNAELRDQSLAEHIMAMPSVQRRRWTRAEVERLVDANTTSARYELVDGELLVTPGPRPVHQAIVVEFIVLLYAYLAANDHGQVLTSPSDVQLETESYLQPDVYVVPFAEAARLPDAQRIHRVLLAIEVLSPGSARIDRGRKRAFYLRHVQEYWIVDGRARCIQRWRAGDESPEIVKHTITWTAVPGAEPLIIDLDALFRRVWRE